MSSSIPTAKRLHRDSYRSRPMTFYFSRRGGYVRVQKGVVSWTNHRPLFSERNGYKVPFMRLFGYRFFWTAP